MSASITLHCDAKCSATFSGGIHASAEFVRNAARSQAGWSSNTVTEGSLGFPELDRTYTYDNCKEHTP